jgi:DNA invertase Pin-like site-specific DNA recombinase
MPFGTGDGDALSAAQTAVPFLVYVRASTVAQDESCDQQLAVAEQDLRALGLLGPSETLPRTHDPERGVYIDDGYSAWTIPFVKRPGSSALLVDATRRRQALDAPGVIWCWALSRLTRPKRGGPELVKLALELRDLGWVIHSHRDGRLDLMGKDGLLKMMQVGIQGEKDAEQSREKEAGVRRAKERQRHTGLWLGGFAPLGYDRWAVELGPLDAQTGRPAVGRWVQPLADGTQNGHVNTVTMLFPSPVAATIQWIFRVYAHGDAGVVMSIQAIAKRLNRGAVADCRRTVPPGIEHADTTVPALMPADWTHSLVRTILKNESYIAVQRDAEEQAHNALWIPLVDRATWDRVRAKLKANQTQRRGVNTHFLLSGLLFCAQCGARFAGEDGKHGRRGCDSYRAQTRIRRDVPCESCRSRIRCETLDPAVVDVVSVLAEHPTVRDAVAAELAALAAGHESAADQHRMLASQRDDVEQRITHLIDELACGGAIAAAARRRIDVLNAEAKALDARMSTTPRDARCDPVAAFAERAQAFDDLWAHAAPAERKALLRNFITRVDVDSVYGTLRISIATPPQRTAA